MTRQIANFDRRMAQPHVSTRLIWSGSASAPNGRMAPPSWPTHQDVGRRWPDVDCESIGERPATGLVDRAAVVKLWGSSAPCVVPADHGHVHRGL